MKPFGLALALATAAFAQQPAFEVASVKPSPSSGPVGINAKVLQQIQGRLQSQSKPGYVPNDRARVTIRGYSLLNLIAIAYRVRTRQISGPEWMLDLRFDVDAKIPEGTPPEQLNEMLQALLAERFALRLHTENRSLAGYALVVGKNGPKLQASTPAVPAAAAPPGTGGDPDAPKHAAPQRAKAQQSPMAPGSRGAHFRRITAAALAEALCSFVDGPVTDMTGLDGQYDIDLQVQQPRIDRSTGVEDPGITIFESLARLGLKLEPRKVLVDTLVIDNVSKTPTEN